MWTSFWTTTRSSRSRSLPTSETDQTAPAFAIYTYELDDATDGYVATGVHHDRLTATVSFNLDIELKSVRSPITGR